LEFDFHNVPKQISALSVSKPHNVPVHVIDVDPAFAVRIAVQDVQGPITESRFRVRLPADPFRAVEIAVFAAPALLCGTRQLVGGRRCVDARKPSQPGRMRARPGARPGVRPRPLLLLVLLLLTAAARRLVVMVVIVAPASAPALALSWPVFTIPGGSRFVRSRQRSAPPNVFLLYFSSNIIVVAFLFVVVNRRDLYRVVVEAALVAVVVVVVVVGSVTSGLLFLFLFLWRIGFGACGRVQIVGFSGWSTIGMDRINPFSRGTSGSDLIISVGRYCSIPAHSCVIVVFFPSFRRWSFLSFVDCVCCCWLGWQ